MNQFIQDIYNCQKQNNSLLCVGLDPNIDKITNLGMTLPEWQKTVVDSVGDIVCAFKPQIAHYSALNAEDELQQIIAYIHNKFPHTPVILDAKRGDIGSTAEKYALEAFEKYDADAVTVNPYLGMDSLQPFLDYGDKGVIALCKTSNLGSNEFQNLELKSGLKLFQQVAMNATQNWNSNKNVLLVVGATYPEELKEIRKIVKDIPLLIPGIGAQGGDIEATLKSGLIKNSNHSGLIISSSRAVIFPSDSKHNFSDTVRSSAKNLNQQINQYWNTNK